jgi:hypothetical protein
VRQLRFIKHLPITALAGIKLRLNSKINILSFVNAFISPEEFTPLSPYTSVNKGFMIKKGKRLNISGFNLIIKAE